MTDPLKHVGAGHYAYDTGVAMAKGELSIDSTFSDYPTLEDAWTSAYMGGFIRKNAKDKQGFKAGWDSLGGYPAGMTDPLKHEWPYDTPEFPYKALTDLPGLILAGEWDAELSAIRKATLKRLRDLKKLDTEDVRTEREKLLVRLKKQIGP